MRLAGPLFVLLILAACGTTIAAPPATSPLGIQQLKFALVDSVGRPDFCDSDFYPIAREGGEQASALAAYPAIQADAQAYAAIAAHEHLPASNLTDAQKLALYRAWKLLRAVNLQAQGSGYAFQYRVVVVASGGGEPDQLVSGTIAFDGRITVASRTPSGRPPCPICLAASTLIATPSGPLPVTDVRPGTLVWTESESGARIAVAVLEVGSTQVPAGHLMVHLRLVDGRDLLASPGHRAADGRALGALATGDELDGSTIVLWELVAYSGDRTFDLLPGGPTGTYWANGILLSSTLAS